MHFRRALAGLLRFRTSPFEVQSCHPPCAGKKKAARAVICKSGPRNMGHRLMRNLPVRAKKGPPLQIRSGRPSVI
jgi:hypothetical protein